MTWSIQKAVIKKLRHRQRHLPRSRGLAVEPLEARCLLSGGVTEFDAPPNSGPWLITAGSDGNLWFTEQNVHRIGRIRTDGQFPNPAEIPTATGNSRPYGITAGSDGNVWYTTHNSQRVGRINIYEDPISTTEFPALGSGSFASITSGPDGNLWFTECDPNRVGQITPDGVITRWDTPAGSCPTHITAGPDGNVWFTMQRASMIGRINLNHIPIDITLIPLPAGSWRPNGIATGSDGFIWVAESATNRIWRVNSQDFSFTPFDVPETNRVGGIFAGPDGNLWFGYYGPDRDKIGRIAVSDGTITTFPIPTSRGLLGGMVAGPDGNLWYTVYDRNKIGKLHVLTATGLTLENAVRAGQPLQAVVANFRDDEPGMLGSHYQVSIDWGDGEQSVGQAWRTAGVGNWVATGGHTYAQTGEYWITVTITDTHAPTGMSTTTYSYVTVSGGSSPGGGAGRLPPDVVAALLSNERPLWRGVGNDPSLGMSLPPVHVSGQNMPHANTTMVSSTGRKEAPPKEGTRATEWKAALPDIGIPRLLG